jgi:hypothetical protein
VLDELVSELEESSNAPMESRLLRLDLPLVAMVQSVLTYV